MPATKPIAGILFDKDGTLLDYVKSWVPVNYELARIAAKGNESLARVLLQAGGMDPETGYVVPDSLLAAGNTVEIATGMVGAGAPFTVEELTALFDGLFAQSAHYAVPVTDLASFLPGCTRKATGSASPPAITSARSGKPPNASVSRTTSITSPATIAAMAQSRSPAWCSGFAPQRGLHPTRWP